MIYIERSPVKVVNITGLPRLCLLVDKSRYQAMPEFRSIGNRAKRNGAGLRFQYQFRKVTNKMHLFKQMA